MKFLFKYEVIPALIALVFFMSIVGTWLVVYYPLYFLLLISYDYFFLRNTKAIGLYLFVPTLLFCLALFDFESLSRSFKFIFLSLALLLIRNNFNNIKYRFSASAIILLLTYFIINPNFIYQFLNYRIEQPSNFTVEDLHLKKIGDYTLFNNSKDSIVLIDFWYTGCGSCFESMDKINRLLKDKPELKDRIYMVNVPLRNERYEDNLAQVKKYNFQNLSTTLTFEELSKIGVNSYPTYIIKRNTDLTITSIAFDELVYKYYLPTLLED